jgi:hypothetical protein
MNADEAKEYGLIDDVIYKRTSLPEKSKEKTNISETDQQLDPDKSIS